MKSGVRLSRVQYTQGASSNELTEISMDCGISGEYPQIMHFVNGLERDQNFFVIRSMALTGQQGGMVNLRLRVSTWLRPSDVPADCRRRPQSPRRQTQVQHHGGRITMAIPLGIENKRQVYIVIALAPLSCASAVGNFTTTPPLLQRLHRLRLHAPNPPRAGATDWSCAAAAVPPREGHEAQHLTGGKLDPALHLDKLAQSEDVVYSGKGRNIFSADSVPVHIEEPVKTARATGPAVITPPAPPRPPAIDLKYFGYSQSQDKTLQAFLMHGRRHLHGPPRRHCRSPLQGGFHHAGQRADHRYRIQQHTVCASLSQLTDDQTLSKAAATAF